MKISTSILDCLNRIEGVKKLNKEDIDYIHIDVMDQVFVSNDQFFDVQEIRDIEEVSDRKLDVHLMIDDVLGYISKLGNMNIEYITFHLETWQDIDTIICKIRELGYKVGMAVKPGTEIQSLFPYLPYIDLALVMSVEPGVGGQSFLMDTVERVGLLRSEITQHGYSVVIEVDGGINEQTISLLKDVSIVVVGSYIVKSDDYGVRIKSLREKEKK